jgi:hypothetical protein
VGFDDVHWPTHCPILGCPIDYSARDTDACWSLDRLDPALGYVPGNVFVMSHRANRLKSFGTAAEHESVAQWMHTQIA